MSDSAPNLVFNVLQIGLLSFVGEKNYGSLVFVLELFFRNLLINSISFLIFVIFHFLQVANPQILLLTKIMDF